MAEQAAFVRTQCSTPSQVPPELAQRSALLSRCRDDCEQSLARIAVARIREDGQECALAGFWPELCSGRLQLIELLAIKHHTLAVLKSRSAFDAQGHIICGRRLEILERVLDGQSLKFIAFDLGLSNSTVSSEYKRAVSALGVAGRLAGLPQLIAQLRFAATAALPLSALTCRLASDELEARVLLVPRADLGLASLLTSAEFEVCQLLLSGRSHAQIADSRSTSSRTTANQTSSIFRKLGVSGRLELLIKSVRNAAHGPTRHADIEFADATHSSPVRPAQLFETIAGGDAAARCFSPRRVSPARALHLVAPPRAT